MYLAKLIFPKILMPRFAQSLGFALTNTMEISPFLTQVPHVQYFVKGDGDFVITIGASEKKKGHYVTILSIIAGIKP